MVPHAYDDSVAADARGLIDAGHDVTLLTNCASDTFVEARRRFPFLEQAARRRPCRAMIGMIKPDRGIYDHHATTFGLDPAATDLHRRQPEERRRRKGRRWQARCCSQDVRRNTGVEADKRRQRSSGSRRQRDCRCESKLLFDAIGVQSATCAAAS